MHLASCMATSWHCTAAPIVHHFMMNAMAGLSDLCRPMCDNTQACVIQILLPGWTDALFEHHATTAARRWFVTRCYLFVMLVLCLIHACMHRSSLVRLCSACSTLVLFALAWAVLPVWLVCGCMAAVITYIVYCSLVDALVPSIAVSGSIWIYLSAICNRSGASAAIFGYFCCRQVSCML